MGQEAQRVGRCWDTGRDSGAGFKNRTGATTGAARRRTGTHNTEETYGVRRGVCVQVCVCVEPVRWSENV